MQNSGLLLKGKIESSFQNENYNQITMHTFTGGYLFGEALVINDAKNSPVQVRAVEDCIILFVDFLNQKVRILSQKSLRDRILIYLGTLPKDKNGFVKIPFTQTALAEYLGVNRSALSRELGRMQNEGLLIVDKEKMKPIF